MTYLQQAWKEVGIEIEPVSLVDATLLDRMVTNGDFQLGLMGIDWTDEDQGILVRSDATPEKGGFNLARYANPEYDELNDAQLVEFDDAKRMELIRQSNNILNEDVAQAMLYFGKASVGFSNRLHNYVPNAYGTWWQFPYVWVEQG
ncbi:MAG: hypothetical protein ACR2OU_18045 [Thermomicrobiales bacterium]